MYTHPITGMTYKKVDGVYWYKSRYYEHYNGGWIQSGLKRGFIKI